MPKDLPFDFNKAKHSAEVHIHNSLNDLWHTHVQSLAMLYANVIIGMAPDFECSAKNRFVGCNQTTTPFDMEQIGKYVLVEAMNIIAKHDKSTNKHFADMHKEALTEMRENEDECLMRKKK